MEPLSGAASVIAVIQITGAITQICGSYISKVKDARQDILRLQEEIDALSQTLESLAKLLHKQNPTKPASQNLVDNIAKCSSTLTRLRDRIDPEATQTPMRKWGFRSLKWPIKSEEVIKIISELERYKTLFALSLVVDQTQSTNLLDQKIDLSRLHVAKGAAFNDYENRHAECLPGTRVELLREIYRWVEAPDGKCIFWLDGMAGTGKSTVARTVASRLKGQSLLGASFFFKRGEQDRGNAKLLFSTLARQLGDTVPQLIPSIQRSIEDDPYISGRVLREQFEKLILQPLMAVNPGPNSILLVVIDALDECDQDDDIRNILRLLPRVQESHSVQLRFLLTSRPDLPIRPGFREIRDDHQHLMLHKIPNPVIEHDIRLYFETKFSQLQQERDLPTDWPGDKAINTLVKRAVPLFISATTLFRFICDGRWSATERLKVILMDRTKYVTKMEGTYMPVLNQLLTTEDEEESQQLIHGFKSTIGILILLTTPLSVNSLAKLLQLDADEVQTQFKLFHSVLDVPANSEDPVRILHLSFRDFLLDKKQEAKPFWVNKRAVHAQLTVQCLKLMQDNHHGLRRNICNLKDDTTQRSDIDEQTLSCSLPPQLRYACRHWMHHLLQSHNPANELVQALSFLQSHFLHWVEVMSLLGMMSEVVEIIQTLRSAIQADEAPIISSFLYDAWRFILQNRQMADVAPLQLYSAGLMFTPENSVIRRTFKSELSRWCQLPKVEEMWTANLQTLEGHSSSVRSVAFSPDSQLLASGSLDNTIKLWDPRTGELYQTLKGHSDSVHSVAFSPDSQLLATGSFDNTIKLWDPRTGELYQTLKGHSDSVHSVVFSPDSQLLATGSSDNTIKLWDCCTSELYQTLEDHSDSVNSVAFSSDSQLLVSISDDNTTKLWDPCTGELRQTLKGHSDSVHSVAFSPDGQLLATGSLDNTIKLWDLRTGELHQTLKGYFALVVLVAFSLDGRLLVTGSGDNTIKLWDLRTGKLHQTLEGHRALVVSMALSLDGQLLASGSHDNTIKLWDHRTGELCQTLNSLSAWVCSVAFSPDGQLLATGSGDKTIKLWNPRTSELYQTLKGHTNIVVSVAFSPDGQLLVSSSGDKTIKLWNPRTSELYQTLKGHSDSVNSVAFSPDSQLLVSGSHDKTIKLWDPCTGKLYQTLKGHSDWVHSVAFSPDSQLLVSGSQDKTIKLWDPRTGRLCQTLKGHSNSVHSVAFSPDSQLLASDSHSGTIKLWDPHTGELHQTLEGHSHWLWIGTNIDGLSLLEQQWIIYKGKSRLWLPPYYRPSCLAFKSGIIALGHPSGRISFISGFS